MSTRIWRWSIGVSIALVGFVIALPFLSVAKGIGRKTLEVVVCVIDTQVPAPVADAKVTIFHGVRTPLENTRFMNWIPPSKFLPDPNSPDTQTSSTDSCGMCSFQYQFTAITSDAWFHHTGNVRVQDTWVQVSAPGRPDALVPIDRQGIHPRDIHDESPIVVTVVMNRCVEAKVAEVVESKNE